MVTDSRDLADKIEAGSHKTVAEVITASPLSPEFSDKVIARLKVLTGKDVVLRHKLDEAILGGIVIRVDGKLLDGSVRRRLDQLKTTISASTNTGRGV